MDFKSKLQDYIQRGGSRHWIAIFEKMGDCSYSHKKLDALLIEQKTAEEKEGKEEANKELLAVIQERKQLYNRASRMHFQLTLHNENVLLGNPSTPIEEIEQTALDLRALWLRIDELWAFEEYFKKNGTAPPKPEKIVLQIKEPIQLMKRRATLLTYLTPSYLNDRKSASTRAAFEARVRAELAEIDKQLLAHEDS